MVESDYRANTRDRLRRAERTIRRLRAYLFVLVVLVLGMCVYVWSTGQLGERASFESVAARSFKLVDHEGNLRGGLRTSRGDGTFLTLADARQNPLVRLGVSSREAPTQRGASLVFASEAGVPRAVLRLGPEEGPRWILMDPRGNRRVLLDVQETNPNLTLFDRDAREIWSAP